MAYMDFGLKNSPQYTTDLLPKWLMHTENWDTRMDDEREAHSNPKSHLKGTAPNNYWFVTCLPMMWKILTTQIRDKIYYWLISRGIFYKEQKGSCKKTDGTEEHILHEKNTRWKNLATAWIDNKKAYDMARQRWILHRLKMYKIPEQIPQLIEKTI